jgi:hypothetical protein
MKNLFVVLLLVLATGVVARAQNQVTLKKYDTTGAYSFRTDTSGLNGYLLKKAYKNDLLARAGFSHSTSQGNVYTMPFDRSACLVPNRKQTAPMPCMKPKLLPAMPNAYKGVPQEKGN